MTQRLVRPIALNAFNAILFFSTLNHVALSQEKKVQENKAPGKKVPGAITDKSGETTDEKVVAEENPTPPESLDSIAKLQYIASATRKAPWGHWGNRPDGYHAWTNHSNRLIPVYTFGANLSAYKNENSLYRSSEKIQELYGRLPINTVNANANYLDQTDLYRLQREAIESGRKKYVFLIVFDGMDWQTTQAASIYKNRKVTYTEGRGNGLAFQDYRGVETDFGSMVTSSYSDDCEVDEDAQQIKIPWKIRGGYDSKLGGEFPWSIPSDIAYPISRSQTSPHAYTDSSSSATSMTAGIKTFNGALNVTYDCRQVETIAHWAQRERGMSVGAVTSVPISHATPAAAYSHNVSRDDFQDISRDLLGIKSIAHRQTPLPGLDVVIGAGWGVTTKDSKGQGQNFIAGNRYCADEDLTRSSIESGGRYVVAQRTEGKSGRDLLMDGAKRAVEGKHRLLGYFGTKLGHLPFQTANGDFQPTRDMKATEQYTPADILENPVLADMAEAAIEVLSQNPKGFWVMIEAGDVDWANHSNNIDSSIGAVFSGDEAFQRVVNWIESKQAWNDSLIVLTADHGHYFNLTQPQAVADAASQTAR